MKIAAGHKIAAQAPLRPASQAPDTPPDSGGEPEPSGDRSTLSEITKFAVGGATGIGLSIAALYAGTLGGAALGAAVGGGFGPMVASVASKGTLDFIGTTFQTAGAFTKAGIVLGGLTGMVGAFDIGRRFGNSLADGISRIGGDDLETPLRRQRQQFGQKTQVMASALTGVGAVAGGLGGFMGGAALGGIGGLVNGSSFLSAATVGGAIGAATFGVVGGWGGLQLSRGLQSGLGKVADVGGDLAAPVLGNRFRRVRNLKNEQKRQDARAEELERQQWHLENRENRQKVTFEKELSAVTRQVDQVQGQLDEVQGETESQAQARFAQQHPDLLSQRAEVDGESARLAQQEQQLSEKESALSATLDREADKRIAVGAAELREAAGQRSEALDTRRAAVEAETKTVLDEARIDASPALAAERVKLREELKDAENDKRRASEYRDAVARIGESTARRLEEAQAAHQQASDENAHWHRLLEQLERGEQPQRGEGEQ